ncbi:MAG: Uma2 family endonuclease [Anaerolineae bacterium]|nr:Uma2 family endonuclease [Anaerolineae bacterium]
MTLSPAKGVTVEEFERFALLPENLGRKLQLINGEIVEEMPTPLHGIIAVALIKWLLKYLDDKPIGTLLTEVRVQLADDEGQSRIPDIAFVRSEQGEFDLAQPLPFVPALCIEIESPGQGDRHMRDLADYYLARGGQMVWLIYPDRRLVEWLTSTERRLLTLDATISGGDVLPGFALPLQTLFA